MAWIADRSREYRQIYRIRLPLHQDRHEQFIYALVDPFLREIRYVGRSYSPHLRWSGHCHGASGCAQAWIRSLLANGSLPELVILERPHWWTDSAKRESAWIRKLANQGEPLLNIRDNPAAVERAIAAGRLRRK